MMTNRTGVPILMAPARRETGSSMNVAEILAYKGSDVATIGPDRSIREAVRLLSERAIGAVVVTDDAGTFIGMLSERDLVRRAARDDGLDLDEAVGSVMTTKLSTCRLSDRSEELMKMMTERRIRHLPVLDDSDELCGIISIGDVVKERVNELETAHEQLVDYVRSGR